MPQIQVLPHIPSFGEKLGQSISGAAGSLTEGYLQRIQNERDQQILSGLSDPNKSAMDVISGLSALSKGKRDAITPLYQQLLQGETARDVANIGANARRDAASTTAAAKGQAEAKLTPFDQAIQKKAADDYFKTEEDLEKYKAGLEDINYLESQTEDVRSFWEIGKRLTGLGEEAAAFDTIAHTILEPIAKIFNPSGPLPQSKLETLRNIYVPKSTDTEATIRGKITGAKRLYEKNIERLDQKKSLLEKYRGNIPSDVNSAFQKETEKEVQSLIDKDQSKFKSEEVAQLKSRLSPGHVLIRTPSGEILEIPETNLSKALEREAVQL